MDMCFNVLAIMYLLLLSLNKQLHGSCCSCFDSYLSNRIIDSFPRIFKWNIIRLKPIFLTPKVRNNKLGINFMIFVENLSVL